MPARPRRGHGWWSRLDPRNLAHDTEAGPGPPHRGVTAQQQERSDDNELTSGVGRCPDRTVAAAGMAAVALAVAGCGDSSGGQQAAGYGAPSPSATARVKRRPPAAPADPPRGPSHSRAPSSARSSWTARAGRCTCSRPTREPSSKCDGACASAWPPLTTSGQADRRGRRVRLEARDREARRRDDRASPTTGTRSTRSPVTAPRVRSTGQGSDGFGAEWYVLSAAGNTIETGELSAPVEN